MPHRKRLQSGQFLRRSARGFRREAARPRRLSLSVERLEPRMMMNGDNDPLPLEDPPPAANDDLILVQPILGIPRPIQDIAPLIIDFDDVAWMPGHEFPVPHMLPESGFESEDALRAWLIEAIDAQYGERFGKEQKYADWPWYWNMEADADFAVLALASDADATRLNATITNSSTNVQVAGVDEADLIETDGEYIYLVSGRELIIVDARDAKNLVILSRVELNDTPTGMYLTDNRLTLVSSMGSTTIGQPIDLRLWISGGYYESAEQPRTTVTVLDVTDRSAPTQVQRTELSGALVSSRMVDGQLRMVLSQRAFALPSLHTLPQTTGEVGLSVYESRDAYLDRVLDDLVDSLLSKYRTYSVDGTVTGEGRLVEPRDVGSSDASLGNGRTTILTFDVLSDEAGPADSRTIFAGSATQVYSTADSLYVFGQRYEGDGPKTAIWKFAFDASHEINLDAKGTIAGTLLNQFAVDEHDGYLRVVTSGNWWSAGHGLFVLQEDGQQLEVVGSVDGLAPGEVLHSVRFMGDRAFAVTFRKVDPLFAIDLSDPTNPQVLGELKIPGYSEYLQPIDENHLLGIGRGAEEGSGFFAEMQISIFDISDLDDPRLAHRYSFGGGRSTASIVTGNRWTEGDGDHHALGYYPSAEILAVPIHNPDDFVWWSTNDDTPLFEPGDGGLQVFSIDTETGFTPLALIEHDSPILRSLQIGDALFAFSAGKITAHDITSPANQWDSLELLVGSDAGLVELRAYVAAPTAESLQALASSSLATLVASVSDSSFDRSVESDDIVQEVVAEHRASAVDAVFGTSESGPSDLAATTDVSESLFADDAEFEREIDAALEAAFV